MKQLHPEYGFNTLAVHSGTAPDPTTGARSFPIYQTTAYVFDDADHAASLFNLQEPGFIYSRLTNPTVAALEEKLATLEGGRGGTVTSSGHAAETLALFPLMAPGMEVIVADKLYGGTINLMAGALRNRSKAEISSSNWPSAENTITELSMMPQSGWSSVNRRDSPSTSICPSGVS